MAFDKTNTGIISKNERKEKDTHPDIRGEIDVDGVAYWLDGWRKERKDGKGFFYSLKVKPKDAPRQQAPQRQQPARRDDPPFDDGIGF
jgi:hypothetical protein